VVCKELLAFGLVVQETGVMRVLLFAWAFEACNNEYEPMEFITITINSTRNLILVYSLKVKRFG
jgi:hypothetical protein